jgi:hypothetical protein
MLILKPFLNFSTLIQRNNMTSPSLSETSTLTQDINSLVKSDTTVSEEMIDPIILAWVWKDYRSELPQTISEAAELIKLPIPMAWLWCHYRGKLPQTAEEKLLSDQLGRKEDIVVIFRRPAKFYTSQIAASIAAGFIGVTLLGQAVAMSML